MDRQVPDDHLPTHLLNDHLPTHLPRAHGLYDPRFEHDACGVGFVARLSPATTSSPKPSRPSPT
jgi:hypothetical protein